MLHAKAIKGWGFFHLLFAGASWGHQARK